MKDKNIEKKQERALFEAILELQNIDECRRFFYDLCTLSEMEEFSDRWLIARLLMKKMPYRQISEKTGVSTTTIGRVARFLNNGNDGYMTVLERLKKT